LTVRKRREFEITDTELKLIAAAAIIGLSSSAELFRDQDYSSI
jgi:hypothetical protein